MSIAKTGIVLLATYVRAKATPGLTLACLTIYLLFCLQQVVLFRWLGEGISLGSMAIRAFALGVSCWMWRRHGIVPVLRLPLLAIFSCLLALGVSVLASDHAAIAVKFAVRYATTLLLLWSFLNLATAFPTFPRAAAHAALAALWISVILGIGVSLEYSPLTELTLAFHPETSFQYLPRISAIYDHPSIFAATAVITALLVIQLHARGESGRNTLWSAYIGVIAVLSLTQARNALVPMLIVGPWWLIRQWRRSSRPSRLAAALVATATLILLAAATWLRYEELTSARQESFLTAFSLGRTYIWAGAFDAWRSHPWFGLGAGVFQFLTPDYTGGRFHRGELHAHNLLLGILSETGLAGLAACAFLLYALWAPLARRTEGADNIWVWVWLAILIGFGLFDFYLPFYGFTIHCAMVVAYLYTLPSTVETTVIRTPTNH